MADEADAPTTPEGWAELQGDRTGAYWNGPAATSLQAAYLESLERDGGDVSPEQPANLPHEGEANIPESLRTEWGEDAQEHVAIAQGVVGTLQGWEGGESLLADIEAQPELRDVLLWTAALPAIGNSPPASPERVAAVASDYPGLIAAMGGPTGGKAALFVGKLDTRLRQISERPGGHAALRWLSTIELADAEKLIWAGLGR